MLELRTNRNIFIAVGSLAAATLLLETTLTRFLAVAQFYHFAFLVISLALLGFGASGSLLSLSPRLQAMPVEVLLPTTGLAFTISVAIAYLIVNSLPFDSYSIAWDSRQVLYFMLYYLALTLPFLCSGLGIGAALSSVDGQGHRIYAANLLGSAIGALLAPLFLWLAGVPGAIIASGMLGMLPIFIHPAALSRRTSLVFKAASVMILIAIVAIVALSVANVSYQAPFGMAISPYKGLVQALRYPGARLMASRWNAISRVDIIAGAGTRAFPGLSYTYSGQMPHQFGLSIDADDVSPLTLATPETFSPTTALPEFPAFQLRPGQEALVLEAGSGLGVLQALSGGAGQVTAIISNPLVPEAISLAVPQADIFEHPHVRTIVSTPRQFLSANRSHYPLIYIPLTDAYRPVTSGAYSLHENYDLTTEAFVQAIEHLTPGGILVTTRWLQSPPSESVRTLATLAAALEQTGLPDPENSIVAYRGIQTMTFLVQPDGWSLAELTTIRDFSKAKRFDLVWAPDIRPDEINRYNRLPEPYYHQAFADFFNRTDKNVFFQEFPFNVRPPTDNRPFFFHFFTWQQTPEIFASLGKTWQPFGGSGYFLLLALLGLVTLLSAILIIAPRALPAIMQRASARQPATPSSTPPTPGYELALILIYYTLIGIAFLFIEIPLIQRFILLLGHPTYAFTLVVLVVLLFSSLGSLLSASKRISTRAAFLLLVISTTLTPLIVALIMVYTLAWPLWARSLAAVICLAPMAIMMGFPFPLGLARLERKATGLIPWAWAVNGCASVIASVLAAIIALDRGFNVVLWLGAAAYAGASLAYLAWRKGKESDGFPLPP